MRTDTTRRRRIHRAGLAGLAGLTALAAAPSPAHAVTNRLCVRWRVDALDRTTGTISQTTQINWNAIGTRVRIYPTGWTSGEGEGDLSSLELHGSAVPQLVNPDSVEGRTGVINGCSSWDTPTPWTGYTAQVYFDVKVGAGERLWIKTYATTSQMNGDQIPSVVVPNVQSSLSGSLYTATITVGSGQDPMTITTAAAAHTLHRADTNLNAATRPSDPLLLRVVTANCLGSPGSCFSPGTNATNAIAYIDPANDSPKRKFVVGHEVGHYLDSRWGKTTSTRSFATLKFHASNDGEFGIFKFRHDAQDALPAPCRWSGQGSHAMRSQEFQRGAVLEGFAHFWAAYAFNHATASSAAQFQYYKSSTASNGGYSNEAYALTAGTTHPYNYVQHASGCNCSNLSPATCTRTSTELQWMRAYWRYLATDIAGHSTKPTLAQLFTQVRDTDIANCGLDGTDRCYTAMLDAAPTTALGNRWASVGSLMGLMTDQ